MKKRRVFQEGLIYVFVFKKFKKDLPTYSECFETKRDLKYIKGIRKSENGMQVVEFGNDKENIFPEHWGKLKDGTDVHIDWCKCIGKEQTND